METTFNFHFVLVPKLSLRFHILISNFCHLFLSIDKNLRIFAPSNITVMYDNLHIEEMRNALGNKTEITIRDIDDFY